MSRPKAKIPPKEEEKKALFIYRNHRAGREKLLP
jgi:hypothetical protein